MRSDLLLKVILTATLCLSGVGFATEPIKLLVIGNSITWHTPNKQLEWSGNWGMAATSAKLDFAHVLVAMLKKQQNGLQPVLLAKNFSEFESKPSEFDFSKLNFVSTFKPDTVVVFLGDNVKVYKSNATTFEQQYAKLLSILSKSGNSNTKVYCVSTWWSKTLVDSMIANACRVNGGKFVDITGLSKLPGMTAVSTGLYQNAGVAAHPSDAGMNKIANKIFNVIKGRNGD